jgi:serine/threonine protein phosphatase PrpC
MVEFIEKTGQWKSYVKDGAKDLELLKAALIQAFQDIDESIRAEQEKTGNNSDSSGCTANTVMLTPTAIICANAGDSRCVLSKKSGIEGMSTDHKPYDEKEKARIEAAGGIVHMKRVDGDLAVSRTFGDFAYKQRRDLPASEQKVSAVPDIKVINRDDDDDEFLILACDGLWDVMTNEEAADNVRRLYLNGEQSPVLIAEEMLDIALEKGKILYKLKLL